MQQRLRTRSCFRSALVVGALGGFICSVASAKPAPSAPVASAAPAPSAPAPLPAPQASDAELWRQVGEITAEIRHQRIRAFAWSPTRANMRGFTRVKIVHDNQAGGAFRIARAMYRLDGEKIFANKDVKASKVTLFEGYLPRGKHTIMARIRLKGHGYGLFSYMSQYEIEVATKQVFVVAPKEQNKIVRMHLKERASAPLKKRFQLLMTTR